MTHSGPRVAIGTSACSFSRSSEAGSRPSRASRFHAARFDDRSGGRRGQEFEQHPGGVRLACGRHNSRRNHARGLQLGREGPEQLGAGDRHDFADQLDAELGLAACHDFGTGRSRRPGIQDRLGFDLFSDTQAIENLLEMDSARSTDCWVGMTIDLAAKSARLKASTEAMSGFADPARTATPIPTRARGSVLSGAILPCWTRCPMLPEAVIATSTISPLMMRLLISAGGARMIAILCSL